MLEALRRPDIWPIGDLALVVSAQEVFGLDERPSAELLEELGMAGDLGDQLLQEFSGITIYLNPSVEGEKNPND